MSLKQPLRRPAGLHWKYWLRITFVPVLARLGRLLGYNWQTLGKWLGRETLLAQSRTIKRQHSTKLAPAKLDVIFLTMIGGHTHNVSVDVVLGLALQARGHRVRFVVCDQQLPLCEVKRATDQHRWKQACAKCWAFGRRYLSGFDFEIIPLSALTDNSVTIDEKWSPFVEASLLKHYRVGVLSATTETDERREMFSRAAAHSAEAARKIIAMQPDRVIMSHGIYSTWGPALQLLNEADVPVVTYGKGKRKATQKFNWSTSSDWWDVSSEWERVREIPLTHVQERELDQYLESRRHHTDDTLVYNFGDEETLPQTRARLRLDPQKVTFVLFTNVLWDAASAHREIVFENPIDWVFQTMEWFEEHPERQLVVKIHPAEQVIGTNQPFASLIRERFPDLPSNVRVIEPDENANSWSIMRVADLGIVHTSTVGMELPLEGIPCAVVSRTHFRAKGFTVDVNSAGEYFDLLETWPASRHDDDTATLARRYAYLLFNRYQLPWDFFCEPTHTDVRAFNFDRTSEMTTHSTTRIVIDAIEHSADFLTPRQPPSPLITSSDGKQH